MLAFWLEKLLALLLEVLTFLMDHSLAIGSCNSPIIGDSCDKNIKSCKWKGRPVIWSWKPSVSTCHCDLQWFFCIMRLFCGAFQLSNRCPPSAPGTLLPPMTSWHLGLENNFVILPADPVIFLCEWHEKTFEHMEYVDVFSSDKISKWIFFLTWI